MPNWSASMKQTFEFYTVDPMTLKDREPLRFVKSCSISRDSTVETLGSASIDVDEPIGESYIRVYLVTIQNGVTERFPLGTFLVQTSSTSFDGKSITMTADAYTPLLELKENQPPLGYSVLESKEENQNENVTIMELAYQLTRGNVRVPVVEPSCDKKLDHDFVANTDDTWLTFISDLMANAKYEFALDELGRILFAPKQELGALQPVWTYTDDNSSILYSNITTNKDLYGIPNVVEVIYSRGTEFYNVRVENRDPDSPVSIQSRGRKITHRVTNPDGLGIPSKIDLNQNGVPDQLEEFARLLLKELSSIEYTVTYSHGYCPVRLGDCVRLDCAKAGLSNVKAKVISQSIKCTPGCQVTEKAVYKTSLWKYGGDTDETV